jgi:hypothetical protein
MAKDDFKTREIKAPGFFSTLAKGILDIHSHRYYRRTFTLFLIFHMITCLLPNLDLGIPIPASARPLLDFIYQRWPLPTFKMTIIIAEGATIHARSLLFKAFEILVLMLYVMDLVPKIFFWKKSMAWKLINIAVITMMVVQVPLTLRGYLDSGIGIEKLRIRTLSIQVSLLLTLEIYSIREQ